MVLLRVTSSVGLNYTMRSMGNPVSSNRAGWIKIVCHVCLDSTLDSNALQHVITHRLHQKNKTIYDGVEYAIGSGTAWN